MVPDPKSPAGPDFLRACLIECDPAREKRDRRIKQRALLVSIIVQILIVAALVLVPLLSKGENIAGRVIVPTVPYAPAGNPNHGRTPAHPTGDHVPPCRFCAPTSIPPAVITHDSTPFRDPGEGVDPGPGIPGVPTGMGVIGGWTLANMRPEPPREERVIKTPPARRQISEPVQTAMLVHRVQPVYPPLAIQLGREGRVELHAIIATDGTIQSLEVISGEPWFIKSAVDAVGEWRYRPTILNGQPIEVDTHITVIYTLHH